MFVVLVYCGVLLDWLVTYGVWFGYLVLFKFGFVIVGCLLVLFIWIDYLRAVGLVALFVVLDFTFAVVAFVDW